MENGEILEVDDGKTGLDRVVGGRSPRNVDTKKVGPREAEVKKSIEQGREGSPETSLRCKRLSGRNWRTHLLREWDGKQKSSILPDYRSPYQ